MTTPALADVFRSPTLFLAFGFGSGCIRRAPGTYGSLAALPFAYLIVQTPILVQLSIVVIATAFGVWLCERASKKLNVHDHPGIVWDEFVGLWITLLAMPPDLGWLLMGFFLFRLFDIFKPWPISWLDRKVKGGFGIMIDDIIAGVMALVALRVFAYFIQ